MKLNYYSNKWCNDAIKLNDIKFSIINCFWELQTNIIIID